MGNQLFKNYDVEKEPQCIGGQNGIWKIYNAMKQDSTKRKVSIWTFDKSKITDKAAKAAKEEIAAFLKKEATSMMKIRHPNIVNLVEPVIEDKNSMAFITERVDDNLYNLMKKNDYQAICQSELELKLQVENILKVLQFLHNDVKTAHLGICPENIFIVNGQWKIAGFTFSTAIQQQSLTEVQNIDYTKRPFDSFCQFYPNLSFSAPEVAETPPKSTFQSDIFSLSLLIMLMYQIKNAQSTNVTPILNARTIGEYSQSLANIQTQFKTQNYIQKDMSEDFRKLISRMLAKAPSTRPTIEQIKESSWMNDPFVKAIYMLDNIVELEQNKQINFLAGMSNILFKYEKPVIKKRIVPQLIELSKFEYLIPPILNVVTDCLKQPDLYSATEFQSDLQPFIIGLTKRKSIPGKALYSLVMNCETYFKFFDKNEFQNVYLVPVLKCFDIPQLQGYVLSQCDFLMNKLEYQFTKTKLLPRILILCTSNVPKLMKQAIHTLKKIIPSLDKHILNDQVLTTLDKLRKMAISDKSIPMLILDIYQQISKSLDILVIFDKQFIFNLKQFQLQKYQFIFQKLKQVIAQKILPSLIPYLIDQSLGKKEFDAYLNSVNAMIKQIENERRKQIKDMEGGSAEDNIPVNNNANNNDDDLFQFENKPNPETQNAQGKDFDFLSMFDNQPKQEGASQQGGNIQNQPTSIVKSVTLNNNNNNAQNNKPVSQIDFNFDMFDNPAPLSNQSSQQNNINISPPEIAQNNNYNNSNSNAGFSNFNNAPISNDNNDFFNNIKSNNTTTQNNNQGNKDPFFKMEYKDPFANQKLSQNIDNMFGNTPTQQKQPEKQNDLFANLQKKETQKSQFNANDLFSSNTNQTNNQFTSQNNNNNMDFFSNSNQASTNNQGGTNLPQQFSSNPVSNNNYQPSQNAWGQQDDPFSDIMGQQSNTFSTNYNQSNTNQPAVNNNQKTFNPFGNSGNLVDINTAFGNMPIQNNNNDLFGMNPPQVQQQQPPQGLFNNLKKNTANNGSSNNPLDDMFGPSPANKNFNNNNNNFNQQNKNNNNNNNDFDLF